jgi:hypothetical protein
MVTDSLLKEGHMAEASEIPERLEGSVRVGNDEALRQLFAHPLDFGCRPTAIREPDGGYSVPVIGSPQALEALKEEGFDLRVVEAPAERARDVGRGNRFEQGKVVPRGFGRKVSDGQEGVRNELFERRRG